MTNDERARIARHRVAARLYELAMQIKSELAGDENELAIRAAESEALLVLRDIFMTRTQELA